MTAENSTDEQIQKDVLEELKWDARVSPNEIGVRVKNGVVTLLGPVDSFYKKWAAEQATLRVRGVSAVANDLELQLPESAERTDDEVAMAAVQAIDADALLPSKNLQITVSNGWLTLRGEVEWSFQKQDAEHLLRRLWGVKGVTNQIMVKIRPTPLELKQQIEEAIVRCAELDAQKIQVEVQGSTAILRGTVRSWAEREEAERTASLAPGITKVDDKIMVSPL